MPKEIFEVVRERFHLSDRTQYIVQGHWPKDAVMEAYLDQHKLKVSVKENENVSALERFKDPEKMQGIQITATVQIPENLEGYHKLVIYEKFPDKKHVWFSITAGELDKKRDKPQVYFEEESAEQGTVRIRGWAIAPKPVTVRIFDADKKPVAAEIQRTDRVDVNQLFEEAQDPGKTGFFSEITNVSGKCLYVVFYAGEKKTVHVVPLRKADILAKKLDKYVEKGIRYWKSQGAAALAEKVVTKVKNVRQGPPSYQKWIRHHLPDRNELEKQKKTSFGYRPKISFVVPLYKTPEKYLRRLTESFQEQTYSNWELCFSDGSGAQSPLTELLKELTAKDNRIKYVSHEEPLQISENTNSAIEIATGDFIAFADHDDELTPNALFECVKAINEKPQTLVIYTDEDKMSMDGHKFFQPHFKPDYNPDLLCTVNYICHLFVVSRKVIEKVGGLRSEFDGAQDYDFVLRCVEAVKDEEICHIPKILYHWRCHEDSTAENPESKLYAFTAGSRAIMDHYKRVGIEAEKVEKGVDYGIYHTTFKIKDAPLVSVIIPNKDHTVDLDNCIRPMLTEGTYKNLEFVIVENNSTEQVTLDYYEKIQKEFPNVHVVRWEREFNYSAINNFGVQHAKGEYLLFMNNDIELIAKNFVEEMLGFVQREDVGIAGARLLYEDDTIQHAGVVIGFGGIAGHTFIGLHKSENSYFNRAMCAQDYSAVTAACMMSKRSVFDAVGGFTEELAVAFNDIDYCMKVRKLGKLVVYAPYAVLHHYESKSRGLEDTPEKVERFNREIATFAKRWPEILRDGDPYYNPNLTLRKSNFALRDLKKEKIGEPYKLEVPLDE